MLPKVIGVFDSGIGGLSVLNSLLEYDIEQVVYCADTAYLPYGQQPYDVLLARGRFIVDFFLAQGITTIVVACHTVSATILAVLEQLYPTVVFIDLLFLTVMQALRVTTGNKVGVLATVNTIASGHHERVLRSLNNKCSVTLQACPLLVPLLEAPEVDLQALENALCMYLEPMIAAQVDTLILGCTHYAFLATQSKSLFSHFSSVISAQQVVVEAAPSIAGSVGPKVSFYVTGSIEGFKAKVCHFGHFVLHIPTTPYFQL